MHSSSRCPTGIFLIFLPSCLLLFLVCLQGIARAKENRIPEELQQWIPWVLYEQEEKLCSLDGTDNSKRYCSWPSSLELSVDDKGATFRQEWLIETRSLIALPGNAPFWPTAVKSGNKALLVSTFKGKPAVWLEPGRHIVTGSFVWKTLPENISIPPETGLVKLTLFKKEKTNIQLDRQGRLWFRHTDKKAAASEESLNVQVFRKIVDGVPLTQKLLINLIVSGPPRQITLGLRNRAPFIPLQIQSPLPVRLDSSDRLQLQVRPGQWQIRMTLRNSNSLSPAQLTMGSIDGPWPEEEIWVFEADPKLRQIEVSSVSPVDPSRTSLPEKWKNLPAYLIKKNESMGLIEKNRGNPKPVPNRLKLHRRLWLDENGAGLTAYDSISGTMTRGWRLNVDPSMLLGRADSGGTPRLITRLKGTDHTGIEVRQGSLNIHAESRLKATVNNGFLNIPASGWAHNFQKLSIELNLPPGWKIITASGIDSVSTWLNRWTLLDIFLVLITGLATAKIIGMGWGAVTTAFLILSYHQPGAPLFLWLPLLALLSIQKVVHSTKGAQICRLAALGILTVIIIASIPYSIHEIRVGLYPQLEYGSHRPIVRSSPNRSLMPSNPAVQETEMDAAVNVRKEKSAKSRPLLYSSAVSQPAPQTEMVQIDPHEMIQTGPGLPDWEWKQKLLKWNGPVRQDQKISLLLLSPLNNTILAFCRVLLLILLTGGFLRHTLRVQGFGKPRQRGKTAAFIFCFLLPLTATAPHANAEVPRADILQELQERLLSPPKCGDHCATINSCAIQINDRVLRVELQVDSLIRAAVPLPGKNRFFDTVQLDGRPAAVLRTDSQGSTLIRVEAGRHTIVLTKDIHAQNRLSFNFPLLPQYGSARMDTWSINGLYEDGRLARQISLSRTTPAADTQENSKEESNEIRIPAFVRVERTLHLGLKWTVSTRIIRLSQGTVIALDIPLLPGEHVTTDSLHIQDGHVQINMGPEQKTVSFRSALTPVESLTLAAPETSSWTERWFLDVSPIWHVESRGIPEINQTRPSGKRYPEFHPYPGESLQLITSRPTGVQGPTMTITRSKRVITPGQRATETVLSFSITASRGMQHSLTLPPGIDLQKSLIDGRELPLQLENNRLIIPIKPGKQDVLLSWRSEHGMATRFVTEAVDLGVKSVNASITTAVPSSRWILLTGGPRIGPAVLFWGELLAVIIIALLLGRISFTPLNTLQWLLLSLGLSQIPSPIAAIVVAWLLLLGLRRKHGGEISTSSTFNLMQVLLVLLTIAAMGALFFAIQQGLLGHPDMQIGGNGSFNHSLHWYQDRSAFLLPEAWIISVPLLAYRISMLLWALWLAMSLLGWIRWGWSCFTDTAVWRKTPKKPVKKKVLRKQKKVTGGQVAPRGKQQRQAPSSQQGATARKTAAKKTSKPAAAQKKQQAPQGK